MTRTHPSPDDRLGDDDEDDRDGRDEGEREPRALQQNGPQSPFAVRGVGIDDDGKQHGVALIRQPLSCRDDAIGDGPHRHRGHTHEEADDDFVDLVIQLVRPVDDRGVDAETGHLAQALAPEQAGTHLEHREHLVGVAAIDE